MSKYIVLKNPIFYVHKGICACTWHTQKIKGYREIHFGEQCGEKCHAILEKASPLKEYYLIIDSG